MLINSALQGGEMATTSLSQDLSPAKNGFNAAPPSLKARVNQYTSYSQHTAD